MSFDIGPDEAYDAYATPPAESPVKRNQDKRPLSNAAKRAIARKQRADDKGQREREAAALEHAKYPYQPRP